MLTDLQQKPAVIGFSWEQITAIGSMQRGEIRKGFLLMFHGVHHGANYAQLPLPICCMVSRKLQWLADSSHETGTDIVSAVFKHHTYPKLHKGHLEVLD
jgi:hypothetical protein